MYTLAGVVVGRGGRITTGAMYHTDCKLVLVSSSRGNALASYTVAGLKNDPINVNQ